MAERPVVVTAIDTRRLAAWISSSSALLLRAFAWLLAGAYLMVVAVSLHSDLVLCGAYVLTGWFMIGEALERVRFGKFEIDSLMLLAALGAAWLGKWAEGALLLFLFSIGHALESYAMGRAKHAIESLADLAPPTALVERNGHLVEVAVEELRVGEIVTIKPNERVSAMASWCKAQQYQSIAGDRREHPVDKRPVDDMQFAINHPELVGAEHRVYAGTINGTYGIQVRVTKTSAENTLSHVVKLVSEAETRTSPTQTLTRRIEQYFVPAVLIFDVMLLFAWLVIDEPFSSSLYRAMAVLVAASPCALAIATPSAVLSGIARAARGGVLIKGGGPLESLGGIKVIAFDKTGTLTEGKPRLTDVVPMNGVSRARLLTVAVAAERFSDHPLASAIVRDGQKRVDGWIGGYKCPSRRECGDSRRSRHEGHDRWHPHLHRQCFAIRAYCQTHTQWRYSRLLNNSCRKVAPP